MCRAFKCQFVRAASLAENLAFLRTMLRELARCAVPVCTLVDLIASSVTASFVIASACSHCLSQYSHMQRTQRPRVKAAGLGH